MKRVISKEKLIKISVLIGIMLISILIIFLLYKENISEILRNRINEAKKEEMVVQTKAQYQIMSSSGENYEIVITIENQNGIETITSEGFTIECKGKNKIALDKKMKEGEEYKVKIKAVGEEEEEYVLIATSKIPIITISNMDTTGDGTTKTIKIEYPNIEKFKNYYSLDDGITWQEHSEATNSLEINAVELDNKTINAKVEVKEGKTIQNVAEVQAIIVSDSLLSAAEKAVIGNNRHYRIAIKDEVYPVHTYVENGDTTYTTNKTYGNASDAGTASANAKNMVLVKVIGNLKINSGVTVTSYGTAYGGTKGLLLYVTGNLENNGAITMTARGAKAAGQNVYLWKNADTSQRGEYEFVPKVGASGGRAVSFTGYNSGRAGATGGNGTSRQTGGGASGAVRTDSTTSTAISGRGGNGTSYSGGAGGGATRNGTSGSFSGGQGSDTGGAGGNAGRPSNYSSGAGGGAGNPGGAKSPGGAQANPGGTGTGGLLILYGNSIQNRGTISSNGAVGGAGTYAGGGSSGGGSINIFYTESITRGTISAAGGSVSGVIGYLSYRGGAGGSGCISIGNILEGTYSAN